LLDEESAAIRKLQQRLKRIHRKTEHTHKKLSAIRTMLGMTMRRCTIGTIEYAWLGGMLDLLAMCDNDLGEIKGYASGARPLPKNDLEVDDGAARELSGGEFLSGPHAKPQGVPRKVSSDQLPA